MAVILSINNDEVKIGTDDNKVVTVSINSISYENPQEGDRVRLYQDGETYIVTKGDTIRAMFIKPVQMAQELSISMSLCGYVIFCSVVLVWIVFFVVKLVSVFVS